MISYLKGLGYKYTTNDTLNDREFRLVDEAVELNEELMTFGNTANTTTYTYEMFLSTRNYTTAKVQGIVEGAYEDGDIVSASSAIVEIQERGYLIQLIFSIGD